MQPIIHRHAAWLFLFFAAAFFSIPTLAAPASRYWALWDKSDESATKTVDHSLWQGILNDYLIQHPEGNRFNYKKVSSQDKQALKKYLKQLTTIDPRTYNKKEQKAYWINLYNALTVDLILTHYPIKSITKIGSWWRFGPWDETATHIASQNLTLNDIEHRILRPLWQDKRIHYAVNCASLGCPDLSHQAYTGANTELLLEAQAERFIQQEKGVNWVDGKLVLSRIYEWYATDFGNRNELISHLRQYSTKKQQKRLLNYTGTQEYQYDWNLNEFK